jgi:glutathione S-transferase
MWDRRAEILFAMPLMLWVRHASPMLAAVEPDQSADVAAFNEKTAMKMARFFDRTLGERAFLAGDRFTIADITALAGMDFAKMLKWRPGEDTPNLAAWRARMAERPCGQTPP